MRRNLTLVVVFGGTALLVAYDVWAAFVPGATISEVMLALGHKHPIIPFALGILMGHFFWSQAVEANWQGFRPAGGWPSSELAWVLPALGLALLGLGLILAAFTLGGNL